MDRTSLNEPRELSFEQLADAHDLRSVISAALDASPMDEQSLRRGIWTFVGAERDVGATPAQVIVSLTQLVDVSKIRLMLMALCEGSKCPSIEREARRLHPSRGRPISPSKKSAFSSSKTSPKS